MSQKKVDSYKAGKNNRSRAAKKEKLIDRLEILAWVAIVKETVVDTSAIDNYVSGLSSDTQ